ncbi:integrase arm-type DNA-binding domain-containing protein [Hypericibacter sp.]|uniref:integrase arm-type DNA-binding domain-containing protein n=1 Tax=Hypericibacter sp. TaxID=2705401 RepID=UPI003D6D485D
MDVLRIKQNTPKATVWVGVSGSKTAINAMRAPDPSGKQRLHWDIDLRGFGVLVSGTTNAKTFIVQREVAGKTRRMTIGPVNVLDLDAARTKAIALLADMHAGVDPKVKQRAAKAAGLTLQAVLDDYLKARKALRPTTADDYRGTCARYLSGWLERPIADITPDLVEKRHERIPS